MQPEWENQIRIWMPVILSAAVGLAVYAAIYITTRTYEADFRGGKDVTERFLEHKNIIPSSGKPITAANLKEWAQTNATAARKYVVPVIVPLDILFLLALGSFLGFASVALASRIEALSVIPVWAWWVFPALYMIADICEGVAIVSLLSWPEMIERKSFAVLHALTLTKLATIWFAIIEFLGLAVLAIINHFHPLMR